MRRGIPGDGTEGPGSVPSGSRSATFAEKQTPTGPDQGPVVPPPGTPEYSAALASQWRIFGRIATLVAVLTAPVFLLILYRVAGTRLSVAIVLTVIAVFSFRGLIEWGTRRFIPYPSLFGDHESRLRAEDVTARRRAWFWSTRWRLAVFLALVFGAFVVVARGVMWARDDGSWSEALRLIPDFVAENPGLVGQGLIFLLYLPALFLVNGLILFGPMMWGALRQIQVYEPGDAAWAATLDDVRGQDQPKEEIRRIVELWQSGEAFQAAGGKQERGVLFLGAPGTGKTMVAKSIANGFNAPFVSAPGPTFTQAFIGIDVMTVLYLGWRARRVAAKWGNKCIVFIDEVDAVGIRRRSLGPAGANSQPSIHDICFFGSLGALTTSGDLVLETEAWRERLFALREPERPSLYPAPIQRMADRIKGFVFPGLMGSDSAGALRQLLVLMDGVGEPKRTRKYFVSRVNTWLDAVFVIPRRIGTLPLRLPPVRPRKEELYFVGACNVPIESLDPALTRAGRMGRHIYFRTPTKNDRKDIFDLYLSRVAHDPELDTPDRREELARITMGHSPARIAQICSFALTNAHHEGRSQASWDDLVQAITTLEAGVQRGFVFLPEEARSTAIHEAGHAITGHLLMRGWTSSRLSIEPRGATLGHHMMVELEERFGQWRHQKFSNLVWTLGAMAAELAFYRETTTGVSGDVDYATAGAAMMVGVWGMPPQPLPERAGAADSAAVPDPIAERKLTRRFEQLGLKLMNRTTTNAMFGSDPVASVLSDPTKRAMVAQLLGQSFYVAYNIVMTNRDGVDQIATTLVEKREMFGEDVVRLIEGTNPHLPELKPEHEATWPSL